MTKMSTLIYLTMFSLMFLSMFILLTNSFNISSMIIILIYYSLMMFFLMSFWSKNYLYSIMMFLTLISGLLIIFMYFTSLISNMMNKFSLNNTPLMFTFMMNTILFIFLNYSSYSSTYLYFMNSNMFNSNLIMNLNTNMFNNIFFIYLYPNNNITLLSMLFLHMSMFMIIKMCSIKSSSLRKIN